MKLIIIVYILCIHIFLGIILFKSDFIERVQNKLGIGTKLPIELTEYYHSMVTFHSRIDGNVPRNATIFIGDSAIQGLCVSAITPLSVNYGIGNDTTVGVLQRISVYESINRAAAVVIFIGFNDMKFRTNNDILSNYASIAQKIPQNVPIIINSLISPDENVRDPKQCWKERIQALNLGLKTLTSTAENLFYVNVNQLLRDDQGNLKKDYHVGDGLHLNSKGNEMWINALQKKLDNIQNITSEKGVEVAKVKYQSTK